MQQQPPPNPRLPGPARDALVAHYLFLLASPQGRYWIRARARTKSAHCRAEGQEPEMCDALDALVIALQTGDLATAARLIPVHAVTLEAQRCYNARRHQRGPVSYVCGRCGTEVPAV